MHSNNLNMNRVIANNNNAKQQFLNVLIHHNNHTMTYLLDKDINTWTVNTYHQLYNDIKSHLKLDNILFSILDETKEIEMDDIDDLIEEYQSREDDPNFNTLHLNIITATPQAPFTPQQQIETPPNPYPVPIPVPPSNNQQTQSRPNRSHTPTAEILNDLEDDQNFFDQMLSTDTIYPQSRDNIDPSTAPDLPRDDLKIEEKYDMDEPEEIKQNPPSYIQQPSVQEGQIRIQTDLEGVHDDNIYSVILTEKPFGILFGTTKGQKNNLYVNGIDEGSVADKAGIITGSMVIKFRDEKIEGLGSKKIYKIFKNKYSKILPLHITLKKPEFHKMQSLQPISPITPQQEPPPYLDPNSSFNLHQSQPGSVSPSRGSISKSISHGHKRQRSSIRSYNVKKPLNESMMQHHAQSLSQNMSQSIQSVNSNPPRPSVSRSVSHSSV